MFVQNHKLFAELGVYAYCAQIAQFAMHIKAYFFRVAQFALRIYKPFAFSQFAL